MKNFKKIRMLTTWKTSVYVLEPTRNKSSSLKSKRGVSRAAHETQMRRMDRGKIICPILHNRQLRGIQSHIITCTWILNCNSRIEIVNRLSIYLCRCGAAFWYITDMWFFWKRQAPLNIAINKILSRDHFEYRYLFKSWVFCFCFVFCFIVLPIYTAFAYWNLICK